jgi:hypothetical protein
MTTVMVVASVLVVAGCGDSGDDGGGSKRASGGAGSGSDVTAELQVRVEEVGGKSGAGIPVPATLACTKSIPATCTGTVTCPPDADSTQASGACDWLATKDARDLLLEEPPARQACTMKYGGPEVATVAGTLDGDPVDATFSRQDGCAIARFDAAQALWLDEQPMDGPGGEVPPTAGEPEVVDDPPSAFDQ